MDIVPGMRSSMAEHRAKTPPQFLKHNMIYEARNLVGQTAATKCPVATHWLHFWAGWRYNKDVMRLTAA